MATFNNGDTYLSIRNLLNDTGLRKNTYTENVPPGASDDESAGYEVGSEWLDNVTNTLYYCTDAVAGGAVWNVVGGFGDADVDTHLNTSSATSGEVLSWTGSDYDWVAQSGGGSTTLSDSFQRVGPTPVLLGEGSYGIDSDFTFEIDFIMPSDNVYRNLFALGANSGTEYYGALYAYTTNSDGFVLLSSVSGTTTDGDIILNQSGSANFNGRRHVMTIVRGGAKVAVWVDGTRVAYYNGTISWPAGAFSNPGLALFAYGDGSIIQADGTGVEVYATSFTPEALYNPEVTTINTELNSINNELVDNHLNTSSATSGEVLSWTGSDYDWVAQSGGGAGLPGNANIAVDNVTFTVSSSADLEQVFLDLAHYRLASGLDVDYTNGRKGQPIIYVDVDPGTHVTANTMTISNMIPQVRFRATGGVDARATTSIQMGQLNIVRSHVRFDGITLIPDYWQVLQYSTVYLGKSRPLDLNLEGTLWAENHVTMIFDGDVRLIGSTAGWNFYQQSYAKFDCNFNGVDVTCDASQGSMFEVSTTTSNPANCSINSDWVAYEDGYIAINAQAAGGSITETIGSLSCSSKGRIRLVGNNANLELRYVSISGQGEMTLHKTGNTNIQQDITVRENSKLYGKGTILAGLSNPAVFDITVDNGSEMHCEVLDIGDDLFVLDGSKLTVETQITVDGTAEIQNGSELNLGVNIIQPHRIDLINLDQSTLTCGDDFYSDVVTAYFGSYVAIRGDMYPNNATTLEVNLIDSKLVANEIGKSTAGVGQINMYSSDLRSEDGIYFSETNGYLQAFGSYIGLDGPIRQVDLTVNNNGIYLQETTMNINGSVQTSYCDFNAAKVNSTSSLTLNGLTGTSSELDVFLGSDVHFAALQKVNDVDTNQFLRIRAGERSTLDITGTFSTPDPGEVTANIEVDTGAVVYMENVAGNLGNCNITLTNNGKFISPDFEGIQQEGNLTQQGNIIVNGTLEADQVITSGTGPLTFDSASTIAFTAPDGYTFNGGDLSLEGNASIRHTFDVVNNGSSDYQFTDSANHWFPTAENDPVLYLRRGETYVFDVNASTHPFEIRVSNGGAAYSTGVTNNAADVGQVIFKVPMSAPATLYYQCTVHTGMGNTINIV